MCEAELADHDQDSDIKNRTWTFLDSFLWTLMTITTVGQENNPSVRNACGKNVTQSKTHFRPHSANCLLGCVPWSVSSF